MNFVEELRWRGMLHDIMPGTEDLLNKGMVAGYIGFDPTADSLHVGSLAQIMTMIHFQRAGHKPFALVGGATGMVGDPSGKSQERNLLSEDALAHNLNGIKKQLEKFLNFDCGANSAEMVNNYDWFKDFSFLNFIRDVGKHITVNYMMAKDSVKNRIGGDTGMSFTEFSYQLVQGYDFYYLWKNKNCLLQMGGSDQWGNIVTGTELIRRKDAGEAYAITTQLIKKSDGTKFGKSEGGNIWLDPKKTSPTEFYKFWRNSSDVDAKTYIKIFTLYNKGEVDKLIDEHDAEPHLWKLQKALAKEITTLVHGSEVLELVMSEIKFSNDPNYKWQDLSSLSEEALLKMFVKNDAAIRTSLFFSGTGFELIFSDDIVSFLSELKSYNSISQEFEKLFESKGEIKRLIQNGGLSINKKKIFLESKLTDFYRLYDKYIYVQKGKNKSVLVDFCEDVSFEIARIKTLLND